MVALRPAAAARGTTVSKLASTILETVARDDPPSGGPSMTEDAIADEMESLIRSAPRSWKEILQADAPTSSAE
jgi:hypothetical protein